MSNAVSGKDQRGVKPLFRDINAGIESGIKAIEENAKLQEDNTALEMANALLKNELSKANDTLNELQNMCGKEILAELSYITKRRGEK